MTHVDPHFVAHLHIPPWQVKPTAVHLFPQLPQLLRSVCVSTHTPLQAFFVPGHLQMLAIHVAPTAQTFPHPLQFLPSVVVSTHTLPHFIHSGESLHTCSYPRGFVILSPPQAFADLQKLTHFLVVLSHPAARSSHAPQPSPPHWNPLHMPVMVFASHPGPNPVASNVQLAVFWFLLLATSTVTVWFPFRLGEQYPKR